MVDIFDPNKLDDIAADSVQTQLGEKAHLEGMVVEYRETLAKLSEDTDPVQRAETQLELGRALQILERGSEAWPILQTALGVFLENRDWGKAADTLDQMYLTGEDQALQALGQGIWLGVTFPIDPEITVHLLSHVIDDTPDDSDGAAVAAATACFLTDMRAAEGPDRERLLFFSQQLLGKVARRHSEVETQEQFNFWIERLELNDPDKFLIRLRNVVDVLVQEDWWFDRDALQADIPAN